MFFCQRKLRLLYVTKHGTRTSHHLILIYQTKHLVLLSKATTFQFIKENFQTVYFKTLLGESKNMRNHLRFLIVLGFIVFNVESFKNAMLQKAFSRIVEILGDRNHEVTLVFDEFSRKSIGSIASVAMAAIPHKIAQFDNKKRFFLNTSALVVLESVA